MKQIMDKLNLSDKTTFPANKDLKGTIEYIGSNLGIIIPADKMNQKSHTDNVWIGGKEFGDYSDGMVESQERRERNMIGLLLLLLQHEGYSDIHCRVKGTLFYIEGRKNQLLYGITVDDLIGVYNKNYPLLSKYAKGNVLGLMKYTLELKEMVFDLQNPVGYKLYEMVIASIMEFSNISFTGNVIYKEIKSQITMKFKGEKYNYRNNFVPNMMEGTRYYNLVIRMLIVRVIKPDYGDYDKIILSMLDAKGSLILIGKTNSGKTSSLAYLLTEQHKNEPQKAYYTFEEPVEKTLEFATQFEVFENPVNKEEGMGFPDYMKAALRMDSNNIMLGEIRDLETLDLTVELTNIGCTIYSTFHAGNLFEMKGRVNKMKTKVGDTGDFNTLLDSMKGVVAQELIPKYVNTIRICDINNKDLFLKQKEIIKDLISSYRTKKNGLLTNAFYLKSKKWETIIHTNEAHDTKGKMNKDLLKEALKTEQSFVKYICENFYVPLDRKTSNMNLIWEMFQGTTLNKELLQENNIIEFQKTEKVFVPIFLNAMITHGGNSTVDFNNIYNISGTY